MFILLANATFIQINITTTNLTCNLAYVRVYELYMHGNEMQNCRYTS